MNLNNPIPDSYFYLLPIAFPLTVLIIRLICLLACYRKETPIFYLRKEKEDECRKVLSWIYEDEHVDLMLSLTQKDLDIEKEGLRNKENICGPRYKKRVILACLL